MFTKTAIALAMMIAIGSGPLAANNGVAPATDVCSHAPGPMPSPTANAICNRQDWLKGQ